MICPSLHREGDEWADGWALWLLPRDPANGGGREESHEVQSKVWISSIRFSCKQNCKTLFFAGLNVITFYVTHLRQGLIPFISIFFWICKICLCHATFDFRAHYKRQASEADGQQSAESQSYVMSDNEREQIADQMRKVDHRITIQKHEWIITCMYRVRNVVLISLILFLIISISLSPARTAVDTDVCIGHGKSVRVQRGRWLQQESSGKAHKPLRVININFIS